MNYIDITENKNTHSVKNRVIHIINREGIQGPKGRDGITPTIDPETGHWMLGDIDTGVMAVGKPGSVPYIDEDGYWCLDGESLRVKATGERGADGATPYIDNNNYHWFINGIDTGVSALGLKGDSPQIKISDEDNEFHWFIGDVDTGFKVPNEENIPQIVLVPTRRALPNFINSKKNCLYIVLDENTLFRFDSCNGIFVKLYETNFDDIIENYVTREDLNNILDEYPSLESLRDILNNYVTKDELADALENFVPSYYLSGGTSEDHSGNTIFTGD